MRWGRRAGLMALTATVVAAMPLAGQQGDDLRGRFGISFVAGDPLGDMGALVDNAFGMQFDGSLPMAAEGQLQLRGDFGFMIYGHETQSVCYSLPIGCRIGLELTTDNAILFGGIGPEIILARGRMEPYVNASLGFAYFVTSSSLGDEGYDDFATTTHYEDAVFSWRAGAGFRLRLNRGRTPVSLDFGVERHENGIAEYLTKGDIVDHPDGSITLYPNRTEANLMAFRFGVSIGIPRSLGGE